jgi:hypothetical protein
VLIVDRWASLSVVPGSWKSGVGCLLYVSAVAQFFHCRCPALPQTLSLCLLFKKSLRVKAETFSGDALKGWWTFNTFICIHSLKVVGNEKEGGSGNLQMIGICLGPW